MTRKLKCYACVDDDCEDFVDQTALLCDDAILCLKWRMRLTDGSTRIGRGCISDDVVPFYACNEPSIYLHTECCHEDLCNGGLFPVLPDLPDGSEMWSTTMITLAVLVPLLVLGLLVCGIFLCYRNQRSRKNRSTTSRPALKLIASGMKTWMLACSSPTSVP